MKDILIRAVPSPLEAISPKDAWKLNAYHNNSGNVAFPFGLFRNLTTKDVNVVSDWYGNKLPDPDFVNENYSMYILPMANDFGGHFANEMKRITKFIKQLKIPVVVVGIGGAFSANPDFSGTRPFDKVTRDFVDAVLERSSRLGLRGEITGQYLKALGYKEGEHYQVIGDPTLYNLGSQLKIRDFNYSDDMKIAFNMTPKAPQAALKFLNKLPEQFSDAVYVPQDMGEFAKIYSGMMDVTANTVRDKVDNFPNKLTDTVYQNGNIKFFLNAPKWIEYMEDIDLSIGTRIHGNVLPTHAGTPTLTMMYGSRLKELAEFHHLPRIEASKVDPEMSLEKLVENVDFHEPERYHTQNFENYMSFLADNGIEHQYRLNDDKVELEFDRQLKQVQLMDAVTPMTALTDPQEILQRVNDGYEISQAKVIAQKERMDRLTAEVKELRKIKKKFEATDNTDDKKVKTVEERLGFLEKKLAQIITGK
jgi:hypothetical protein